MNNPNQNRRVTGIILLWTAIVAAPNDATADFVVTVDSNDLRHSGAGIHSVDLLLTHDTIGDASLDGIQIDIVNAPNATVRQGPVETDFMGTFLSSNINAGNRFGVGSATPFLVPAAPGARLGTLVFDVTDDQDFTIDLGFVLATRGFAPIAESVAVPNSFTVRGPAAVPEPSTVVLLLALLGCFMVRGRVKRTSKA